MSELTRCNRCKLNSMVRLAAKRGATVHVSVHVVGEWAGWTSARYSDAEEPSAWFLELTEACAC